MSYQGMDDDIDLVIEHETNIDLVNLAALVRAQLLKDARGKGNLFGPKAAQRKTPLASKPQVPGNRRVW